MLVQWAIDVKKEHQSHKSSIQKEVATLFKRSRTPTSQYLIICIT